MTASAAAAMPDLRHHSGRPAAATACPPTFLVAPDGQIVARMYREHAYDEWTVDELLALAGSWPGAAARNVLVSDGRMH
jgi:hypothetical protein